MKQERSNIPCWVCNQQDLKLIRPSQIDGKLGSQNFLITNSDYGKTAAIYQCQQCGFKQCPDLTDVISFYEEMQDNQYEEGREQRLLQEQKVMAHIRRIKAGGKLLDIGAGSGILLEAALTFGFDAEGVEPSKWLHAKAVALGLPVHLGIFPQDSILKGPYDVVTLVDVIEHVSNPVELIQEIKKVLKPDGILVVVTPDVDSFMARLLRYKWWHFRIAHIGYFNKKTLNLALQNGGFKLYQITRPTWFFSIDYLLERVSKYLPGKLKIPASDYMKKIVVPVNLRDSWMGIYQPQNPTNHD